MTETDKLAAAKAIQAGGPYAKPITPKRTQKNAAKLQEIFEKYGTTISDYYNSWYTTDKKGGAEHEIHLAISQIFNLDAHTRQSPDVVLEAIQRFSRAGVYHEVSRTENQTNEAGPQGPAFSSAPVGQAVSSFRKNRDTYLRICRSAV